MCGVCLDCVQAWLNCVDPYVYEPIDDRIAELYDVLHAQRYGKMPSSGQSVVTRLKVRRLRR